jgi:uncharacterized membrane protein YbhN (UPF0104 family)
LEKQPSALKRYLKLFVKIGLSALAMYLVFTKIELKTVWALIRSSHLGWLVVAFVLFNISKVLSAFRLLALLRALGIYIDHVYNLKICYVGMFYNLFLPGSIGGDGYKVVHLKRRFDVKTKHLVASVLIDRISGGAILVFLAILFALPIAVFFIDAPSWVIPVLVLAVIASLPALALVIWLFFKTFYKALWPVIGWSFGVQLVQVLVAYAILLSFGVDENFMIYFVLFLVSSLASMLPISFGGVGLRELVFLYASQYFPIDETAAIALGLMYFIVIAASSFIGIFLKLPNPESELIAPLTSAKPSEL